MRLCLTLVAAVACANGACLSNHYLIPHRDLQRIAQEAPPQRGEHVRVVQEFATDTGPPAAPEVHAGAVLVVDPVPGPAPRGPGPRPRRASSSHAGHTSHGSRGHLAEAKADDAKAAVVLAVLAGVGLAATEGARYDGWVRLNPMHPVHLYFPDGSYTWMPLAQLDPETAAAATKAFVRDSEGPWQPLGRAPLDRRGLTYSVFLGGGQFVSADDSAHSGFQGHIQFGLFPVQTVGLNLDLGLGWANNATHDALFDSRYALELDVLPVQAGPVHGGLFGQGGVAHRFEDGFQGVDMNSVLAGGGVLMQLELTTRLALSARAGMTRLYGDWVADIGAGLSIY